MHGGLQLVLAIALATGFAWADRLQPVSGREVEGSFTSYRNGTFELVTPDGKTQRKLAAATRSMRLDPPRTVRLFSRTGPGESVELTGYDKGQFLMIQNGRSIVKPLSHIQKIEVPFSAQVPALQPTNAAPAPDEPLFVPGKPTVVHFHLPSSVASVRQGGWIERLVNDRRGAVEFRRITVTGWTDEIVRAQGLTSLPQFWFYNAKGERTAQATERFTDDDLSQAFSTLFQ